MRIYDSSIYLYSHVLGEIGPDGQLFEKLGVMTAKYGPIMQMKGIFAGGHFVFLFEPEHFEQVSDPRSTIAFYLLTVKLFYIEIRFPITYIKLSLFPGEGGGGVGRGGTREFHLL